MLSFIPVIKFRCLIGLLGVISCVVGCAGTAIPREQYSSLQTPRQTFEFAQKAVGHDDPEAFYHCLSSHTRRQVPLSDLRLGWALAGSFFYLFLEAKLQNLQIPAPEYPGYFNTAKIVLASEGLQAAFLMLRENGEWRLAYPSPYPLPNISKIKRRGRLPWRTVNPAFYQQDFLDWQEQKTKPARTAKIAPRLPSWRSK